MVMGSPLYVVAKQLFTLSPLISWNYRPIEGKTLGGRVAIVVVITEFLVEIKYIRDVERGWLFLNTM
jgi:hypothetical protein